MAAGDLIVADWQHELRGVLMGPGTAYAHDAGAALSGLLGVPSAKVQDVPLAHAPGHWANRNEQGTRIITVPMVIRRTGTTKAADAIVDYVALVDAWDSSTTTDVPYHWQLPGIGRFVVYGRPLGLDDDGLLDLEHGVIRCLGTFSAGDPTIETIEPED